ncbi:hypothetical protein Amsp01_010420 [Amycolatopsis sp. NBRC 101858]|nr:hypothetical protein Amsp01_010420 [Amycolatopsis sp. NBRC 101858]
MVLAIAVRILSRVGCSVEPTVGRVVDHGNRRGAPVGDPGKWWFGSCPTGKPGRFPQVARGASAVIERVGDGAKVYM